jgi:hypothetical protein
MKLAFYAPLKPPDHPVPSGDRAMARNLIETLKGTGALVTLASRLRSRDGTGDDVIQQQRIADAAAEVPKIIARGRADGWQAWITYHSYYKAPDLLGPQVATALAIPYLQIEATRARKRLGGPWDRFAQSAEAACDAADVIFFLTTRDAEALHRDAPQGQKLVHLRPFLATHTLPPQSGLNGPMLAVGMMRAGDKLASYEIIAQALSALPTSDWHLRIAGDGPARSTVETLMAPFGQAITFLGQLDAQALETAYQNASLLLWPGVNEAFGLAYLEAQAAGVPVVAQDRPGVRDVLAPGQYPAHADGADALADRLELLLSDPAQRKALGATARTHIKDHHLMDAATATLLQSLRHVGVTP